MSTCETCRYWSERVARAVGHGPVQAICLAPAGGVFRGEWVSATQGCDRHEAGRPVDSGEEPPREAA